MQRKAQVSSDNRHRCQEQADAIHHQLSEKLQKAMELAKQKGASSWLTTLPLTEHGFALHKAAFHDARPRPQVRLVTKQHALHL